MIKDVLQNLDTLVFGQIAMILFGLIFIAVVIFVWTRPKKQMDQWSHIPLSDEPNHEQKQ